MPNKAHVSSDSSRGNSVRRWLIIGGVILVVLLALVYGFVGKNSKDKNANKSTNGNSPTAQRNVTGPIIAMSLAQNPSLVPPTDLTGFTQNNGLTAEAYDYDLDGEAGCNIQFGTANSSDLPGDNLVDLAKVHMSATPEDGATITSQENVPDLVLNDATKNQRYSMQTVMLSFTRDNVSYTGYESAAFLLRNQRIFVRRYCINVDGEAAMNARLSQLEAKVKDITVKTQ